MPFRVTTPPVVEPLHLNEIKAHLRITQAEEDLSLLGYVTEARQAWEDLAGRALIAQTVTFALDDFPCGDDALVLPRSPVLSTPVVTYRDTAGALQTFAASNYSVDLFAEPNELVLNSGAYWPVVQYQRNAVLITYVAGYATPFTAVAATDVLTFRGRAPILNEVLRVWNSGGSLPGALFANTDYYVVNVSGQTCKLSLTQGGSAIDLADGGAGLHYTGEIPCAILDEIKLWVGDRYENREGFSSSSRKFVLSHSYRLQGTLADV